MTETVNILKCLFFFFCFIGGGGKHGDFCCITYVNTLNKQEDDSDMSKGCKKKCHTLLPPGQK